MEAVHHWCYDGDPLPNQELARRLGLEEQGYSFLVATAAQERLRTPLTPARQLSAQGPQLVFHKALRHLMGVRLLTRAEERVALRRAMERVAGNDPVLASVLRHDAPAWRDALAELVEQGIDLEDGVPLELARQITNPDVAELLRALQSAYRREQREHGRASFEDAARAFITRDYQPPAQVVMEGFTFLTPLQQCFAETVLTRGAQLHFVYPDRDVQREGFAVLRRTYAPFTSVAGANSVSTHAAAVGDLAVVQRYLFSTESPPSATVDGSVSVTEYRHRHHEIAACIDQIKRMIEVGVPASEIAIVVRDVAEFQAMLQEEADLQALPVTLGLPPRLLLLTPLGRFVLALYDVWHDGDLHMDAEQFETIITSGWLGGHVQQTADPFNAVKAQAFARCTSLQEWAENFQRLRGLRAHLRPDARVPAASIDEHTIRVWEDAVQQVGAIAERLFSGGPRSIAAHVRQLLDELSRLDPELVRQAEREVLARIQETLTDLADETSLEMTPAEFSEVLNSLVRERERLDQSAGDADPEVPARVWVTTPEGIDGYQKPVVFFLGVDDRRVPRPYPEPWPFYEQRIAAHQERERYYFLAVARATGRELHYSFARADGAGHYRPSPYLEDVCRAVSAPVVTPVAPTAAPAAPAAAPAPVLRQAYRTTYALHELAHFRLCPYRYKLERLDARAGQYRDAFQLRFAAEGEWLHRIFTHLEDAGADLRSREQMVQALNDALRASRVEVTAAFPGFRPSDWHAVQRYVRRALAQLLRYRDTLARQYGEHPVRFVVPEPVEFVVNDARRTIRVDASARHAWRFGDFEYVYTDDLLHQEWLIPGVAADANAATPVTVDGVSLAGSLYHAVQWWQRGLRDAAFYRGTSADGSSTRARAQARERYRAFAADLPPLIEAVQAGRYPKHPGELCQYCPVRVDCLGLEP